MAHMSIAAQKSVKATFWKTLQGQQEAPVAWCNGNRYSM